MVPLAAGRGRLVDHPAYVDQVVSDYPETDPALHSVIAGVSASIEAVTTFAAADATFASTTPTLAVAASSPRTDGQRFWWNDWECRLASRLWLSQRSRSWRNRTRHRRPAGAAHVPAWPHAPR